MKIAVIGAGKIGSTVARLFAEAGHEVLIANSRGPASLTELAADVGARAATSEQALAEGEIILLAIPFARSLEIPAGALGGKIVIDANNYYPARDGQIADLDSGTTTSSELLAKHLHGARVVKAFNTMNFKTLAERGDAGAPRETRLAILVSGDDSEAKAVVSALIEEIGFAAVEMGSLPDGGRRQQPGATLYNVPASAAAAEAARGS